MELNLEGFERRRKKERLRSREGREQMGGSDSNSAGTQGKKTDLFFPGRWKSSPVGSACDKDFSKTPSLDLAQFCPFSYHQLNPGSLPLISSFFFNPLFAGLLASNVLNSHPRYILNFPQTLGVRKMLIQTDILMWSQFQIFCPTLPIC